MKNKRILITGARGFLGSHVTDRLKERGYGRLITPSRSQCDFSRRGDIEKVFRSAKPQIVLHLAARVGGIGANQDNPGRFFYENAIMGLELMEISRLRGIEKFVTVGTVCSYPKFTPVPFREKDLWNGYPEETNAPYGLAKKMLLVQAQAYRRQYGLNTVYLIPVNMYGPRDDFDARTSHVIPALIRKFMEAQKKNEDRVVIWGNGSASREFLYVEDCAEAVRLALEKYGKPDPVNVGTGHEITIRDLAGKIKDLIGFKGRLVWDKSKPNGQPRRRLDVSKARKEFGFKAKVSFEEGLKWTIDWYKKNVDRIS